MSLLEVKNLTYTYGKSTPFVTHAVDNVSFKIEKGEIIGLIGHTGSGKSTIVQQLNGLIKPESGEVVLDGKNIWTEYKNISEVRFKVGLVFQYPEYQLFEDTCIKDISFGPKNMGLGEEEAKKRALEAARLVGLDEKLLAKSPFDLSGGEKRRVAIAGIIAMQPEVLVLDEPTAGLDPVGRDTVLSMIKEYRASTGAAVIIVSHSMEDMAKTADKLLVMNSGRLCMFDTVKNVFSHAKELEEIGLDIPEVTKIASKLADNGLPVDRSIYTVEALFGAILSIKKGGAINA